MVDIITKTTVQILYVSHFVYLTQNDVKEQKCIFICSIYHNLKSFSLVS